MSVWSLASEIVGYKRWVAAKLPRKAGLTMHRWSLPEVREEGCGGGDPPLPNTEWPVVGILP